MSLTKPLASQITYNSGGGGISAVDLQAAISELDSEKTSAATLAASGGAASVGYLPSGTGAIATTVQSKLRESVSVFDFMTDAQIASVTSSIGTSINFADPSSWPTTIDVTSALQAAINTKKSIYIPDGFYGISSSLMIDTYGQRIYFASRQAIIKCISDIDGIIVKNSFVEIENGSIYGAAVNTTSTTSGIRLDKCIHGHYSYVFVAGFGYGLKMFGATDNYVNRIDHCYFYQNRRAGIYGAGHATTIVGGEIAGSVYGVLHAKLQDGTALAIDRDYAGVIGQAVSISGCTIEAIGLATIKNITSAANNGSGLIRITATAHDLSTGDIVSIYGVGGTIEANGVWPITVIDANTFDLKASVFSSTYTSGGSVRRGVGIYSGIGNTGAQISDCYFESVPVAIQYGDSFKNDGTTAHTSLITGGKIVGCFLNNNNTNGCLVATARASNITVMGNSGFQSGGFANTLLNSINDNYNGQIANFNNYGFSYQYAGAGSQVVGGMVVRPNTKNGSTAFEVLVPTALNAQSLSQALRVTGYNGSPTVQIFDPIMLLAGAQLGIGGPIIKTGTGTPEGVVSAGIGSLFLRSDGGVSTTMYVKQSGTGNTGWAAK